MYGTPTFDPQYTVLHAPRTINPRIDSDYEYTESLGWGEKFHAARIFALYSNLGRAALEGVPLRDQ